MAADVVVAVAATCWDCWSMLLFMFSPVSTGWTWALLSHG